MDELVGHFGAERPEEVGVPFKKTDVLVVGGGDQRVDLDGEGTPVLEKKTNDRKRQAAVHEALHERTLSHPIFPAPDDLPVQRVEISLGLPGAHFYSELWRLWLHQ